MNLPVPPDDQFTQANIDQFGTVRGPYEDLAWASNYGCLVQG